MEQLVSVIVPTYKRSLNMLNRSINSLLNQSYKNIEIIIVDDSPADFSERSIIKEYMLKLSPVVRYFQNQMNLGGSLSRNRGIELSSGDYITFLDDDDEYKPQKIENQIKFMINNELDMSFSNMLMMNDFGRIIDVREYSRILKHDLLEQSSLLKYHLMYHLTGTPTFMYKAEKLKEIDGFDDAIMGQEYYLMLKTIENKMKIGYLNEYDVIVHKHDGESISNSNKKIIGEKELYKNKRKFFGNLSFNERRYVKFRHNIVMAIAYKRNTKYFYMLTKMCSAFFIAPDYLSKEVLRLFVKLATHNKTKKKGEIYESI